MNIEIGSMFSPRFSPLGNHMEADLLVGDIGGTNVRLALVRDGQLHERWQCEVRSFASFERALAAYLADHAQKPLRRAAFAIAAPVVGDEAQLTNHPWKLSRMSLEQYLGTGVTLLNDFQAVARSIPFLVPPSNASAPDRGLGQPDCRVIGPTLTAAPHLNCAVIGPGTGLGVAGLIWTQGGWQDVPGEGGHTTLPAETEKETAIIGVLRHRWEHVSAERALSGPGLVNLYEACCQLQGVAPVFNRPDEVTSVLGRSEPDGHEAIARHACELFCAILGTVAGNLALTFGARGGVYIAGGILRRFPEFLAASAFRSRFEAKGRFRPYLEKIPTILILHDCPSLVALAHSPDQGLLADATI
jgi:glucokinase